MLRIKKLDIFIAKQFGLLFFGTFFICGLGEEDFTDMPDDLMDKYAAMFHRPEVLIAMPMGYVVLPAGAADEIQVDSE